MKATRAFATLLVLVSGTSLMRADVVGKPLNKQSITAAELEDMLASEPAPKVVHALMGPGDSDPVLWDFVLNKIESGDATWLRIAVLLGPGMDGAVAEDLIAAEAEALPRSPDLVLALFGASVCFISEASWPSSLAAYQHELAKRRDIVKSIRQPRLNVEQQKCLDSYASDYVLAEEYYSKK